MGHKKAADQPGHAKPKPGADDNTRLAFLEGCVPLLHAAVFALAGRYAPTLELAPTSDEDPVSTDLRLINEIAALPTPEDQPPPLFEDLSNQLLVAQQGIEARDARIAELEDAAKAGPDGATPGEIAALARADEAEKALVDANATIAELRQAIADAVDDSTRRQDPEVEPSPIDRAAIECSADAPAISIEDLRVLVDEGQQFALIFSDGSHEIVAIGPVDLPAANLHRHAGRYVVAETITVKGMTATETIDGAGLFVNGEQVKYCRFDPPIAVNPGEIRQFNRSIAFG
jgi:hypothetical protein